MGRFPETYHDLHNLGFERFTVPCSHVIQVSPPVYIFVREPSHGYRKQVFITFQGPTLKHVHMLKLIA